MKILVHTSFIGDTGYNNHARSFFTALNKFHTVKIRNYTVGKTWTGYSQTCHDLEPYLTEEHKKMLILQSLHNSDGTISDYPLYNYNNDFKPDINIILNDVNHYYFYNKYEGYTIGFNVWETTEYPQDFFNQISKLDEFWVPSEWQKNNLIKQGYPENKIKIVHEGVDVNTFFPEELKEPETFRFLLFGRWEYRKSTQEIIETFIKTFDKGEKVELLVSAENPFASDGIVSAKVRLNNLNIVDERIKVVKFPEREDYVNYLKTGHVFLSCARSEGWNLPLIEALSCATPSIYSNWGAQLEYAKGVGIPVSTLHKVPASTQDSSFPGDYIEPDFDDLSKKMKMVYNNYIYYKMMAISQSEALRQKFNWETIAENVVLPENKSNTKEFVFVTTGNLTYMPVIEKLVKSLNEFSKMKIIVYGVNCDIPFDYPNLIKKSLHPPFHSKHDKWYWKQYACIESLKENYENFVWIDGDAIANFNIDDVSKYFDQIENYPISDIHRNEEFYAYYTKDGITHGQPFNQHLSEHMGVVRKHPFHHICFYIYNKKCIWWFVEILETYKSIDLDNYYHYFLWNDEGIDNCLRWKYGFTKHLPQSNFDTSSYDGDNGQTSNQLKDFYTFWTKRGPYNFDRVFGFQYIPKDKSNILYFHGNKDGSISDKMIDFIKLKKENTFFDSGHFYVGKNDIQDLSIVKGVEDWVVNVAHKYSWAHAIYHEIYNQQDYYHDRIKRINKGDTVVDLGGNIGVFNRWAYLEGAEKVISFEPDKRYFELLSLNADPRSILFNAAISNKLGDTIHLFESNHLGGSNVFGSNTDNKNSYPVRTYTLNYLFEMGLVDQIDFLKIDVEGAEMLAFDGISDDNLMKVKNISMEYHHAHLGYNEETRNKFIGRLNKLGFNSFLLFLGYDNVLQLIYFWR